MKLSVEERDRIFQRLNEQQQQYLMEGMNRSRRTIFANELAKQKGSVVADGASYEDVEHLIDSWIYTGYIDAGAVSNDYRCECGRPLRYQHIVEHKQTGEVLKFGINHLQEHLKLDPQTVSAIKKGFDVIDYELDDILTKYAAEWSLDQLSSPPIEFDLPQDMQDHLSLDLPLLDRQIATLRMMIQKQERRNIQNFVYAPPAKDAYPTPKKTAEHLFDMPLATSDRSTSTHELSSYLKPIVLEYLQSGVQSVRVMCELLIKHKHISAKRFMTGKPDIYGYVCIYIEEELVQNGVCRFIEGNMQDRQYAMS